ncbi:MAG: response regulator transcription factor [Pseudomonadota bacterium]
MPPENQTSINLLIVDDHELVRDGIRARLETASDIEIIGEAVDGESAIKLTRSLKPDLVLMDINMPGMSGLDAVAELRHQGFTCGILVLSLHSNSEYISRARALGTNGYVLKDCSQEEMISAIRMAASGGFYERSPDDSAPVSAMPKAHDPYGLTDREREVLCAIARGKLNKQIAGELDISVRTVESHRSTIRQKTGGGNAASLVRIAAQLGLGQ